MGNIEKLKPMLEIGNMEILKPMQLALFFLRKRSSQSNHFTSSDRREM